MTDAANPLFVRLPFTFVPPNNPQRGIVPLLPDPEHKKQQPRLNQRCAAATMTSAALATNVTLNEIGAGLSLEATPVAAIFHSIAVINGLGSGGSGGFAVYAAFACYNAAEF